MLDITGEVAKRKSAQRATRSDDEEVSCSNFSPGGMARPSAPRSGLALWRVVGEDEFGNRYYRTKGGKIDPTLGFERRWVIYNGYAEASTIPPSWHGWMHHTVDTPPTESTYQPRAWQKPHRPNLTGTPGELPPARLDAGARPPPQGNRRLQGLDSRIVRRRAALSPPYSPC